MDSSLCEIDLIASFTSGNDVRKKEGLVNVWERCFVMGHSCLHHLSWLCQSKLRHLRHMFHTDTSPTALRFLWVFSGRCGLINFHLKNNSEKDRRRTWVHRLSHAVACRSYLRVALELHYDRLTVHPCFYTSDLYIGLH